MAFANALLAGDNAAIRATSVGSDEDYTAAEAMGLLVSSLRKLSDAAAARYGPDNAISAASANLNLAVALRDADVKVDGETATVFRKNNPAAAQAKLVHRDGRWRVDLASLPKADMAQIAVAAPIVNKAATELAAEIAAGRYKTAADTLAASQRKRRRHPRRLRPGPAPVAEMTDEPFRRRVVLPAPPRFHSPPPPRSRSLAVPGFPVLSPNGRSIKRRGDPKIASFTIRNPVRRFGAPQTATE